MQLGRFLNSCLNRWESQVASDDGQQPRVHARVRNQMHPKSPFGALQGIWQRRHSLCGGHSFYPRPARLCSITPGICLCSRIPISKRGLVMDLNCRWRKAVLEFDSEAKQPLCCSLWPCTPAAIHPINISLLKGCLPAPLSVPLNLSMWPSHLGCWSGLGCFGFHLSCGNRAAF